MEGEFTDATRTDRGPHGHADDLSDGNPRATNSAVTAAVVVANTAAPHGLAPNAAYS